MRSFMSLFVSSVFVTFMSSFLALDTVTPHQLIKDGDKLVSAGGTFELGFFSPGNPKDRYLGIWYVASPGTVVWVANREDPIRDGSGVLKITGGGVLNLVNITDSTVWSSNASATAEDAFAQLLDSGNLVVRDSNGRNQESYLWQSFDYPCDTFLQRMKVGKNLVTGLETFLSSWKSAEDPAPGEYSLHLDTHGFPQMVIRKGSSVVSRFGPLNVPTVTADPRGRYSSSKYQFTYNESEIYVEYRHSNSSVLSRYALNPSGTFQHFTWVDRIQNWVIYSTAQADQCQNYAWCGAYGSCNSNKSPVCECLKGFNPKSPKVWSNGIWFDGCERRTELNCHDDGFLKYLGVKLPDTSSSLFNETMDLKECGQLCLKNCSCTAYANLYIEGIGCLLWFVNLIDISELSKGGQDLYVRVAASELAYANLDIRNGGSGCLLWFHDLIGMKQLRHGGQDLYIRVSASEIGLVEDNNHGNISKTKLIGIAVGSTTFIVVIIMVGLTIFVRKKKLEESGMIKIFYWSHHNHKSRKEDLDLPTFDLPVIAKATDNFSGTNKLGEGGFGPVYKGILTDGQELAVKRLSKNSGQGLEEFKNEVALIAKLQHRNLVKLLGYCIQGEEKMLIYEYMPNKSLDYFMFDENRSKLLDWCKRFHIIGGIARGLVYLHQDSRLRIIHRDLKTSNILLDENMNPKISDFGLARIFWGDQVEANTNKVAGTYGYMPPEYAVHGHFSMKSDVFSFGVVVLEIVSGKKNRGFSDPEHYLNLLGHAWRLRTDGRPLELMDTFLGERCTPSEVIRCIHVGLLCVQQRPEDRPDMTAVILMLNGEKSLPQPKVPGFYTGRDIPEADSLSEKFRLFSKNDISLTVLEAR